MGNDNPGQPDNSEPELSSRIAQIEQAADESAHDDEMATLQGASKRKLAEFREQEILQKVPGAAPTDIGTQPTAPTRRRLTKKTAIVLTGLLLSLAIISSWLVPTTRYALLNVTGKRGSLTIHAGELAKSNPDMAASIMNFSVSVDGRTYMSGNVPHVAIPNLKYGQHDIVVSKQGYTPYAGRATVDLDPYFGVLASPAPQPVIAQLVASGTKVTFLAKDWTSGTPLRQGEFKVGDRTSRPNEKGEVTIVAPPSDSGQVVVEARFKEDYLSKTFTVKVTDAAQEVLFVPSARHYFVSKRSGVYSIYSMYLDGSDMKEVIKGTPQETQSIQFAVSPNGKRAVMVSTREGTRNEQGNLLQKLYLVDLSNGTLEHLDSGMYMQLFDWANETIAYSYGYSDPKETFSRTRLRTLNTLTNNRYDIATTTGYFGQVYVTHQTLLFTQGESANQPGAEKGMMVKTSGLKGENGKELASGIGLLRQLGFDTFAYENVDKKWSEFNINTGRTKPRDIPSDEGSIYLATQNEKQERLLVDFVDGKQVVMMQKGDGANTELAAQNGIVGPIRFLSPTTLTYRIMTQTETADYAVSTLGGEPKKITDVTASSYGQQAFFRFY